MIPLSLLRRIDRWVREHMPVICAHCQRWKMAKSTRRKITTSGLIVSLCNDCEKELYHPWERQ